MSKLLMNFAWAYEGTLDGWGDFQRLKGFSHDNQGFLKNFYQEEKKNIGVLKCLVDSSPNFLHTNSLVYFEIEKFHSQVAWSANLGKKS